jgi:arginine exporter protein ArgO
LDVYLQGEQADAAHGKRKHEQEVAAVARKRDEVTVVLQVDALGPTVVMSMTVNVGRTTLELTKDHQNTAAAAAYLTSLAVISLAAYRRTVRSSPSVAKACIWRAADEKGEQRVQKRRDRQVLPHRSRGAEGHRDHFVLVRPQLAE